MQRTVWPPPLELEVNGRRESSKDRAATEPVASSVNNENNDASGKTFVDREQNPDVHHRLSSDGMPLQVKSTNTTLPAHRLANYIAREQFYNGIADRGAAEPSPQEQQQQRSMETEENW